MRWLLPKSFAKRLILANFITSLICVMIIVSIHLVQKYRISYDSHKLNFRYKVNNLTADFLHRIEALSLDASFLASEPPIQGLLSTQNSDSHKSSKNNITQEWTNQIARIFKEMLIAKPHYSQIRLIGVGNGGKEIVRVEWRKSRLQRTNEQLLQDKSNEEYYIEAIKAPPGEIYLSEFTLNREWGRVENPPKMVIRAATPIIGKSNQVFAIVVINMLAEKALAGVLNLHKSGIISDLYNSKLESLITSEANGWIKSSDINKLDGTRSFLDKANFSQPIVEGRLQDFHVLAKKIYYDPLNPERFLGLTAKSPLQSVFATVWTEFAFESLLSVLLVSFAMFILYLAIKKQTIPLSNLRQLASKLSKGERVPHPPDLSNHGDELSELANAFYEMANEIKRKSAMLSIQKEALDETALVSETDCKGKITYANQKFAEITGFSQNELLGSSHRIINS